MKNTFAANIIARNRVNQYIREHGTAFFEVFREFQGKKIIVGDGGFVAALKTKLAPLIGNKEKIQIFANVPRCSVSFVFKTCEHDSEFSVTYQESSLYVCDLDGANMGKMYPFEPENFKTYDEEEIAALRAELHDAEKVVSKIKDKLGLAADWI